MLHFVSLFIAIFAVIETILQRIWYPKYFRIGTAIFSTSLPLDAANKSDISENIWNETNKLLTSLLDVHSMTVKKISEDEFFFKSNSNDISCLTGRIVVDEGKSIIHISGNFDWYIFLLPPIVLFTSIIGSHDSILFTVFVIVALLIFSFILFLINKNAYYNLVNYLTVNMNLSGEKNGTF